MSHTVRVPLGEIELPGGDAVPVGGQAFGPLSGAAAVVLAGLHGDAAEGVAAALTLAAHWTAHPPSRPVILFGCLNPLAVLHGSHRWPGLDVDFASRLPGDASGHAPDRIAAALFEHLEPAERVIELGAPDPGMWEAVHAEVWGDTLVPVLDVPLVRHSERAPPGSPGAWGAIRLRGGRTGRVHPQGVAVLVRTVLDWVSSPMTCLKGAAVHTSFAEAAGVFIPRVQPGARVAVGDILGELDGIALAAREPGVVIALRDKPTAHVGSVLARVAWQGST